MPQFPSPGQNFPTFAMSDGISGGVFLVDATATTNAVSQADLAAQATATMNVIALVQTATASQPMGTLARPMAGLSFPPGDGGSGTGYTNSIHPFTNEAQAKAARAKVARATPIAFTPSPPTPTPCGLASRASRTGWRP